ncbi:MAG: EamA family transporter [Chloroflexota bacterium]
MTIENRSRWLYTAVQLRGYNVASPRCLKVAHCMSQVNSPVPEVNTPNSLSATGLPPWTWVIVAVLSVQLGAAIAKQLFETVGPSGVVFLRTLLAGILFIGVWRPQVRGYSKSVYGHIILFGIIIAAMMLSFYAAIDRIPLGITVAIAFAGPLGIAVMGSRKLIDLIWVTMAAIGILLLSPITDTKLDPIGVVLAFVSALTWAIYIVLSKRVNQLLEGNSALALAMCVAAIFSLPFGISGAFKIFSSPSLIVLSLVIALLSSAIPFWLEFKALKTLSSRVFGLLVSLEPVVAALIGFVILHEALGLREISGIALVTAAAVATTRSMS